MTVATAPAIPDLSPFLTELRSRRRDQILGELVRHAHRVGCLRSPDLLLEPLRLRERSFASLLGKGVALPSLRSLLVSRPLLVGGRCPRPVEWGPDPDGAVDLVLLALAPAEMNDENWHAWLARAAGLGRLQRNRQRLLAASTPEAAAAVFREVLA